MSVLTPYRHGVNLFDSFRQEMEGLFEKFSSAEGNGQAVKTWAPQVDVEESEKEFIVKADLPGVEPKDVDVQVVDNVLTIRGGKEERKEEKKKNYHRVERFSGSFYRAIPLPAGVDVGKVTAASSNGVVTIHIPKSAESQPRKIAVTAKT